MARENRLLLSVSASVGAHLLLWVALTANLSNSAGPSLPGRGDFSVGLRAGNSVHRPIAKAKDAPSTMTETPAAGGDLSASARIAVSGSASDSGAQGGAGSELASAIHRQVEGALHYPVSLQRRGISGEVKLKLLLSPTGELVEATVTTGSGHAELDALALDAVKRAAPFSAAKTGKRLSLNLPITFRIPNGGR